MSQSVASIDARDFAASVTRFDSRERLEMFPALSLLPERLRKAYMLSDASL